MPSAFLDTSLFIYLIEQHPRYVSFARNVFAEVEAGNLIAVTSVVTLLEVLVVPLRDGQFDLAAQYRGESIAFTRTTPFSGRFPAWEMSC